MINLLSPQKKTQIKNTLLSRFFDGLFFSLILTLIGLNIFLVPIYFHLNQQQIETSNLAKTFSQNDTFTQVKNTYDAINASNENLKTFPDSLPENGYIEATLNSLLDLRGPQTRIRSFKYSVPNKADPKATNIEILGTARNRVALLDFKQRLESSGSFSSIVLPIASFVKVDNIDFNIRLKSN